MGFLGLPGKAWRLGMSGKTWKKIGKVASIAAPIAAAPFTGGASLALIGAGAGAGGAALEGKGLKGILGGAALGGIPGGGGAAGAAKAGVGQAVKQGAKTAALSAGKSAAATALEGGNVGNILKAAGKGAAVGGATGAAGSGGLPTTGTAGRLVGTGVGAATGAATGGTRGALTGAGGGLASSLIQGRTPQVGGAGMNTPSMVSGFAETPASGIDLRGLVNQGIQTGIQTGINAGTQALVNRALPSGGRGGATASTTDQSIYTRPGAGPTAPPAWNAADITTGGGEGIPWGQLGVLGGGAVGGLLAGRASERNALQRTPEEQLALRGAQGIAGQAGQAGMGLLQEGRPWMGQAGQYYQTLLRGNRGAMNQAVAPYAAQITDAYRGAARNLQQSGVRGAARDVAKADLNRQRASQIAGLVTGMQPGAAEALGRLGTSNLQAATPLIGHAGNIYGNLLNQGALNRQYAREQGGKTGEAIGGLTRDIIDTLGRRGPATAAAPKPPKGRTTVQGNKPQAGGTGLPTYQQAQIPQFGGWAPPASTAPDYSDQYYGVPAPTSPNYSDQYYGG
jgi:hypothetical protein